MARATLTEYTRFFTAAGVVYPWPDEASRIRVHTAKTSFSEATAFDALNAETVVARLSTDTALHYRYGDAATQNDTMVPADQALDIPVSRKGVRTISILAKS